MEFDGKTAAEVDDSASLDIVDGITIEFWALVKGGEAIQSGVEKGSAWVSGLYNLAALYNGGTILQFFDLPEPCNDDNIGPSIQDGEWHFLAGTWDGEDILLYIDGELEAEMPCKGKLKPNDESLYIGARGGSQRFLTGALDEIKVYNYALPKEELLQDMEAPVTLHVDAQDKLATVLGTPSKPTNPYSKGKLMRTTRYLFPQLAGCQNLLYMRPTFILFLLLTLIVGLRAALQWHLNA